MRPASLDERDFRGRFIRVAARSVTRVAWKGVPPCPRMCSGGYDNPPGRICAGRRGWFVFREPSQGIIERIEGRLSARSSAGFARGGPFFAVTGWGPQGTSPVPAGGIPGGSAAASPASRLARVRRPQFWIQRSTNGGPFFLGKGAEGTLWADAHRSVAWFRARRTSRAAEVRRS